MQENSDWMGGTSHLGARITWSGSLPVVQVLAVQGYLTCKKTNPPGTLPYAYA